MKTSETQTSVLENQLETSPKPPRVRQPWFWLLIALLLVGGGVAVWRMLSPIEKPSLVEAQALLPRPVETVALTQGDFAAADCTRASAKPTQGVVAKNGDSG